MDLNSLVEIKAIKHLKARYFRFLDAKQWTDWRTCFTDDLHFFAGQDAQPLASSADEFVAYVSKLLAGTVTVHHGHMPEIELTSATRAGRKLSWNFHRSLPPPEKGEEAAPPLAL